MNKFRITGAMLLACVILSACQQAEPPAGEDVTGKIEISPSSSQSTPAPSEQPAASSQESSSSEQAKQPEDEPLTGPELLRGEGVSLLDWQWLNNSQIAILHTRKLSDGTTSLRLALWGEQDEAYLTYEAPATEISAASSTAYADRVEFHFGGQILTVWRDDGNTNLQSEDKRLHDLLPMSNEGGAFDNLQFSTDELWYFYERFPLELMAGDAHISDAVITDTVQETVSSHPVAEITFPFDVRVTPKTMRWVRGGHDLLVTAELPDLSVPQEKRTLCLVYDARSGEKKIEFSPEADLLLRDAANGKILYERTGVDAALIVYDYRSQQSASTPIAELARGTRFSPDGGLAAIVSGARDLNPRIYPLEQPETLLENKE